MPYKNKKDKLLAQHRYLAKPEKKELNKNIQKFIYWREQYCKFAKITVEEFKKSERNKWTLLQLQSFTKEIKKSVTEK